MRMACVDVWILWPTLVAGMYLAAMTSSLVWDDVGDVVCLSLASGNGRVFAAWTRWMKMGKSLLN